MDTTPPPSEETVPLWHDGVILPPNSRFSQEIFKLIRPGIPQHGWPVGQPIMGLFQPLPNGMGLVAEFEHLSADHKRYAEYLILEKGAPLVMESPAAPKAVAVYKAKSWRDVSLYALLPVLFMVPVVDGLVANATHLAVAAAAVNLVILIASQLKLTRAQTALSESRFIAHIPTPGMKISIVHKAN